MQPEMTRPRDSITATGSEKSGKSGNAVLWIFQGLLAALFLFAGVMKLAMPIAEMAKQARMPGALLQFIGVAEIAGGLGLLLPGLLKIKQWLTPLAATGLLIIMAGATVIAAVRGDWSTIAIPIITGVLLAVVGYLRWQRLQR